MSHDGPETERLITKARELAATCCAPQLSAFATWAASARDGDGSGVQTALATLNEPYTAARLAVDFLRTVPRSQSSDFRAATSRALESMGARATLAQLTTP